MKYNIKYDILIFFFENFEKGFDEFIIKIFIEKANIKRRKSFSK